MVTPVCAPSPRHRHLQRKRRKGDAQDLRLFPASRLRHRPADRMLLGGLGSPASTKTPLENSVVGITLQRGHPGPCSGPGRLGPGRWGHADPQPRRDPERWPRLPGWERGAGPRSAAFSSGVWSGHASFPAGSREEGHLQQRLFTFLSWLWAGQAIFKLFVFF